MGSARRTMAIRTRLDLEIHGCARSDRLTKKEKLDRGEIIKITSASLLGQSHGFMHLANAYVRRQTRCARNYDAFARGRPWEVRGISVGVAASGYGLLGEVWIVRMERQGLVEKCKRLWLKSSIKEQNEGRFLAMEQAMDFGEAHRADCWC